MSSLADLQNVAEQMDSLDRVRVSESQQHTPTQTFTEEGFGPGNTSIILVLG